MAMREGTRPSRTGKSIIKGDDDAKKISDDSNYHKLANRHGNI